MVKRMLITIAYIIAFWAFLPFVLLYPSLILDRAGMRFHKSRTRSVSGIVLSLLAIKMLFLAIGNFSRSTHKLPITALPPYNRLATSGLYEIWRHPIYLFYTMLFVGVGLIIGSGGLLLVVLPIFIVIESIHAYIEEIWLLRRHGKAYRKYRERSSWVIPKRKHIRKIFFALFASLR